MTLFLLLVVATPLSAAGPCGNGAQPRLSGDVFSPIECSTATAPAAALTGAPPATDKKMSLKDLAGRWEGALGHALGRYELLLTIATRRGGKMELALAFKERQFHDRQRERLVLTPAKDPGAYSVELTADRLPGAALAGEATLGFAAEQRQADLSLANGAKHRVYFQLKGKDELHARALSAVPGAPLQILEVVLHRTKRESL